MNFNVSQLIEETKKNCIVSSSMLLVLKGALLLVSGAPFIHKSKIKIKVLLVLNKIMCWVHERSKETLGS